MSVKKKHTLYWCKDCEIDYIVKYHHLFNLHNPFCPKCGKRLFVEKVKDIWVERPYIHHKRYTVEEDDIIIESRKRGIMIKDIVIDGRTTPSIERRWYRLKQKGVAL